MSVYFNVIPIKTKNITFKQVINEAEEKINNCLKSVGINDKVELIVNIRDKDEKYIRELKGTELFTWNDSEYAWFTVKILLEE